MTLTQYTLHGKHITSHDWHLYLKNVLSNESELLMNVKKRKLYWRYNIKSNQYKIQTVTFSLIVFTKKI